MAKKRHNKEDDVFRLEEENRELKALNRSLLKQLKKKSKGIHREYSLDPDYKEPKKPIKEEGCTHCGKGILNKLEVAGRVFKICNLCKHRIKI